MTTKPRPKTLIVTPTYNERENLETFAHQVFENAPDAHLAIVDDNSPDGTGILADEMARKDPRIQVFHRSEKLGLGSAYIHAFTAGLKEDYELFFEMDTDLSHDPRYLGDFFEAFKNGADLVIGSRNIPGGGVEGWGLGRHVLSKGGSLYSRLILGIQTHDLTSGYKGFRRRVLEDLDLSSVRSEGYSFQVEVTYRALKRGFRVDEVPIVFVDRQAGTSKMTKKIFLEAVMLIPKLRLETLLG